MTERWSIERYRRYTETGYDPGQVSAAVSPADLEQHAGDEPPAADAGKALDSRVCIKIHSRRRRAIDPDGLYSKAAIDGLREGGILADDSAKHVEAISYSQEKSEVEETVITLELVD
jgi:hypothetical protein